MANEKKYTIATANNKGLKKGAIGTVTSSVIAVASTGPALVVATVVGTVAIAMGVAAPGMEIFGAIPVFMCMLCFRELNRDNPDCGTAFAWVTKAVGPKTGFLAGWCLLFCSIIIMPGSAYVIALNTYALFDIGEPTLIGTVVLGVFFIAVVTLVCYLGIEVVAWMQKVLVIVELGMVIWLIIDAIKAISTGNVLPDATPINGEMFNIFSVSPTAFAAGFTIVMFGYWGWDMCFTLSEETEGEEATPFRSSAIALLSCCVLYTIAAIVLIGACGIGFVQENCQVLLDAAGSILMNSVAAKILIVCVFSSALACTQATILPASRQAFSMAAHRLLPVYFAHVHAKFKSPTTATVGIGVFSAILFIVFSMTSENVLWDSMSATGMLVAFYYFMTCLACFAKFRDTIKESGRNLFFRGIIPIATMLIMIIAFILCAISNLDPANSEGQMLGIGNIFWFSVGVLAVGVILLIILVNTHKNYFSKTAADFQREDDLDVEVE